MEARAAMFVRAVQGVERQSEEDRFTTAVSPGSRPSQSICFMTAAVCPCALEFQSLRNKNKERAW